MNKSDWWDQVTSEDFSGRTHFQQWTPVQKLMWLSQIQRFVATAKGKARTAQKNPASSLL